MRVIANKNSRYGNSCMYFQMVTMNPTSRQITIHNLPLKPNQGELEEQLASLRVEIGLGQEKGQLLNQGLESSKTVQVDNMIQEAIQENMEGPKVHSSGPALQKEVQITNNSVRTTNNVKSNPVEAQTSLKLARNDQ